MCWGPFQRATLLARKSSGTGLGRNDRSMMLRIIDGPTTGARNLATPGPTTGMARIRWRREAGTTGGAPMLPTSTGARTAAGSCTAVASATPPPYECPTTVTSRSPSVAINAAAMRAFVASEWPSGARSLKPCPGRSYDVTRIDAARSPRTGSQSSRLPMPPWTSSTSGPCPSCSARILTPPTSTCRPGRSAGTAGAAKGTRPTTSTSAATPPRSPTTTTPTDRIASSKRYGRTLGIFLHFCWPPGGPRAMVRPRATPRHRLRHPAPRRSGCEPDDHARADPPESRRAREPDHDPLVDERRRQQPGRVRAHARARLERHGSAGGELRGRERGHLPHRHADRSAARHALLLPAAHQRRRRGADHLLHDARLARGGHGPLLHRDRRLGPGHHARGAARRAAGGRRPAAPPDGRGQHVHLRLPERARLERARLLRERAAAHAVLPRARQPRPERRLRQRQQLRQHALRAHLRAATKRARAARALLLLRLRPGPLHGDRQRQLLRRHADGLARERPRHEHRHVEVRLPPPC